MPFDSEPCESNNPPDFAITSAAIREFNSQHPYLLFHEGALERLRERAEACPKLHARFEEALGDHRGTESARDVRTMIKRNARRLIDIAFMALVSDGVAKADAVEAARAMLREFARASSWNHRPVIKSFLDRAETALAVGLAYDWLYDKLSVVERRAIEEAIARHILEPALAAYSEPAAPWTRRRNNCAIVSNSGILIAALAVAERYRDISERLVQHSLASAWDAFSAFAPDGGWPEGLSYWSLAVRYAGLMVAALESALGDSFGLAARPGFARTGDFALYAAGPFGAAFDFGDSVRSFDVSPLAWLAHRFRRAQDGWRVRDYDGSHLPLALIWSERPSVDPQAASLPTGKIFRNCEVACFRNTWSAAASARPVYLAIKGGSASLDPAAAASSRPQDLTMHAQADAGSFIVDGARQRWVSDLGPDDYDLPGYFEHGAAARPGRRWRYYRNRTAGHNTLIVDGRNQVPNAPAPVIGGHIDGDRQWVVFDLSAAYGKPARTIRRGAALIGRQVVVQDEIAPGVCDSLVWAMHTSADPVSLSPSVARFKLGEDRFVVRILSPRKARLELVMPPPPGCFAIGDPEAMHGRCADGGDAAEVRELPRGDDEGGRHAAGAPLRRLEIVWPKGTRRLVIALFPDSEGDEPMPPVTPLEDWLAADPPPGGRPESGYESPRADSGVER